MLVTASVAPPATPTVDGKAMPVGLPVAAELMLLPPHWMPMSRVKVVLASTMRASMSTCGVCVSRWFTRSSASEMLSAMSVTMSWLVRASTDTWPRGDMTSLMRGRICVPSA